MKRVIIGIVLVGLLLMPLSLFAGENSPPVEGEKVIDALLTAFPNLLNETLITELRNQGYGYGEIAIIATIASQGSTSIADVVNYAKENNLGWGEVAKYFGVELSKVGINITAREEADKIGLNYLYKEEGRNQYKHQEAYQYEEQQEEQQEHQEAYQHEEQHEEQQEHQEAYQHEEQHEEQHQHQEAYQHEEQHGQNNRGSR